MKKQFPRILTLSLLIAALLLPGALAESITMNGTVTAARTAEVYAPIGGAVASVPVEAGQTVNEGDVLATLRTTKVYAEEDGTITGLFAQVGDAAETIAERYGAVMYIEGNSLYTISASTENAYNSTATKFVSVGERVFLSCNSDGKHTGRGVITSIEGIEYKVRVLTGEFLVGETVNVYRGRKATASQRIGRGELTRNSPTAVTGSGSIVSIAVKDGDAVSRGDLLFETLDGSFDGLYATGTDIVSDVSGVVSSVNVQQGGTLQKDSVVAVIWPADAMRIEAEVDENDLGSVAVGDPVSVELTWNQDDEVTYPGTITMISAVSNDSAEGGESEATYKVLIDFTPDENTRYGMSAVITTGDDVEDVEDAEEEEINDWDDVAEEPAEAEVQDEEDDA